MENKNKNTDSETYLAKWLEGEIKDSDLKRLISETDFLTYKKLKTGIDLFEELEEPLDNSYAAIQDKIALKKKNNLRTPVRKWAASIAASLLLLLGLNYFLTDSKVSHQALFSEQKTITLLDKSEVILNSKSHLTFDKKKWETSRNVFLEGEAFFKVEKGSTFTVHTNNGSIQVLGTQFNVNNFEDYFEVICFEGKVKVTHHDKEYILLPSESFRKINGNPIETIHYSSNSPTWILGESAFKSVPLKYVVVALEKQFDLTFNTAAIDEGLLFTGSFTHQSMDIALASVFKTMNISYTPSEKRNIILKR